MHPPTTSATASPLTRQGQEGRTAFLARLAEMTPKQRVEAARRGDFDRAQRALWVATYPDEEDGREPLDELNKLSPFAIRNLFQLGMDEHTSLNRGVAITEMSDAPMA